MDVGLWSGIEIVDCYLHPAPFDVGVEERLDSWRHRLIFAGVEFVGRDKQHFTIRDRDVLVSRVDFDRQNREVLLETGGWQTIQYAAASGIASRDRKLLVAGTKAIAPSWRGR